MMSVETKQNDKQKEKDKDYSLSFDCNLKDVNFELNKFMDKGVYGSIYKTNRPGIVCKIMKRNINKDISSYALRELVALTIFQNIPQIVQVKKIDITQYTCIYMEECECNLYEYMKAKKINLSVAKSIAWQLLVAMYTSSQYSITHRDIKLENILVKNGKIKLADWGMTRFHNSSISACYTNPIQTMWYRDPKLLAGKTGYSTDIDMWSFGCILYELITGEVLFKGHSTIETLQLERIFKILGTPSFEVLNSWEYKTSCNYPVQKIKCDDPVCSDLLNKIIVYDKRISLVDALNHETFKDIRTDKIKEIPIITLLCDLECKVSDYMPKQKNFNESKRVELITWMDRICEIFKYNHATYFLAVKYLDLLYSSKCDINTHMLYACACLSLAVKINEVVNTYDIMNFVKDFKIDEFVNAEKDVIISLNCRLFQPTEYSYLVLLGATKSEISELYETIKKVEFKLTPLEVAKNIMKKVRG